MYSNEDKEMFFQSLSQVVVIVTNEDKVLTQGDCNARVGSYHTTCECKIGRFGKGKNSIGGLLLNFYTQRELSITNTLFLPTERELLHTPTPKIQTPPPARLCHLQVQHARSPVFKSHARCRMLYWSLHGALTAQSEAVSTKTQKASKRPCKETGHEQAPKCRTEGEFGFCHHSFGHKWSRQWWCWRTLEKTERNCLLWSFISLVPRKWRNQKSTNGKTEATFKRMKPKVQREIKHLKDNRWNKKAEELQEMTNKNDLNSSVLNGMRAIYGPRSNTQYQWRMPMVIISPTWKTWKQGGRSISAISLTNKAQQIHKPVTWLSPEQ